MNSKTQMFVSCVLCCLLQLFTVTYGFDLNHLQRKTFNHRIKRDSGIIAFRPLFVYRQQQKEKQAKWKLEEAHKLQLQLQQQHLQIHPQNPQNSIVDYNSKYPVNVAKVDYRPTYPVYSNYQTTSPYQTNVASQPYQYQTNVANQPYQYQTNVANQPYQYQTNVATYPYQYYQNYQQNAYGYYPAYSGSYSNNGAYYANTGDSLYDSYDDSTYYQ